MKNIINRYIEKIKKEHAVRRKVISVLLCLALVVSVGVFWNLRLTGISMTTDVACNIEEHVHDESCNEKTLICVMEESEEHTHADECYETMLICAMDEHAHTVSCLSDETADVEIASDWEASLPTVLNGNWAENVLSVAKSQLGYTESEKNFVLDEEDNSRKGYTRYGQWYGNLYADWNTMFMAFCLNYAEVPEEAVSRTAGCYAWVVELTEAGLYKEATDYVAEVGDIVFFDTDEDEKADKVGIVSEVTETEIITVEGDYDNSVAYVTYTTENSEETGIVGVLDLNDAYLAYSETKAEELAKAEEVGTEVEGTEVPEEAESEVEATVAPTEGMESEVATEEPADTVATEGPANVEENSDETTETEVAATEEPEEEISFEMVLNRFSFVQNFSEVALSENIYASGTTSNGLTWQLDNEGVLTISGTGSMPYYQASTANKTDWLEHRYKIKKVIISEGITSISNGAFYYCNYLSEIIMPSSITSIDNYALYNCDLCEEIVLSDGVESIGGYSFSDNSELSNIVLNEGLIQISSGAFRRTSITNLVIPSTVTSIGGGIFSECKTEIDIMYNAISATSLAATNGKVLSLVIGDMVDSVPQSFYNFISGVEQLKFSGPNIIEFSGDGVASSPEELFKALTGTVYVDENGVLYKLDKSNGTASLAYCPLGITTLTIPESITISLDEELDGEYKVTGVESYAISSADDLTTIVFEDINNITNLADYALAECPSLFTVVKGSLNTEEYSSTNLLYEAMSWFSNTSVNENTFINTGLVYGYGNPMFSMEKPAGGVSSVTASDSISSITIVPDVNYDDNWVERTWEEESDDGIISKSGGYYEFLTGQTFTINPYVSSGGSTEEKEYRIYIESTNSHAVVNYEIGKTYVYHDDVNDYDVEYTYKETEVPGVTYFLVNVEPGETLTFPLSILYRNLESGGGGVRVWGTICESDSVNADKYISSAETIQAFWKTEPDSFTLVKRQYDTAYKDLIGDGKGNVKLESRAMNYEILFRASESTPGIGDNFVEWVEFKDTLELPSYAKWPDSVIEDIKNGNVKAYYDGSGYIYFKAGDKTFAYCYVNYEHLTYYETTKNTYDFKLYLDEENNVVFSFKYRNPYLSLDNLEDSQEIKITNNRYFNFVISQGLLEIDVEKYSSEEVFNNTVSAEMHYMFEEEPTTIYDSCSFKPYKPFGNCNINKTESRYSSSNASYKYGNSTIYNISMANTGALNYNLFENYGEDIIITDTLDKWYYIKPEHMQMMLNEEYGKYLTISINNATLCTDDRHMSEEVTTVDGNVAYITGENSNLTYRECDLIICWENDSIVVKEGTNKYIVEDSLKATLDELNYIMINESTVFTLSWDLSETFTDGILYGGDSRSLKVCTTLKNTFQHGTDDYPINYNPNSVKISNTASFFNNQINKSTPFTGWAYEASIGKSLSVNGTEMIEGDALYYGDILDYTVSLNKNSGRTASYYYDKGSATTSTDYHNLPIVDYMSGVQSLLVPVNENGHLKEADLRIKVIDDVEYYILSKPGVYNNVYVGTDASGILLIANDITVSSDGTIIKWYYTRFSNGTKKISYKAMVDISDLSANQSYVIDNRVYANDRTKNRIYADIPGYTVEVLAADKEIYDIDNKKSLGKHSVIGEGETVEYRLSLETVINDGYTVYGNEIWDVLPNTHGDFVWSKDNVSVELAPDLTGISSYKIDEWWIEQNQETGEYVIKWPNDAFIKFESSGVAYLYVTLIFPDGDYWADYTVDVNGTYLENIFCVRDWEFPVTHQLKIPGEVYLQKGVYDVGCVYLNGNANSYNDYLPDSYISKGNRNYYSDPVIKENYVTFYVTICNKGTSRMYLTDIVDELPEGYTIKRFTYSLKNSYPSRKYNKTFGYTSSEFVDYTDSGIKFMYAKVNRTISGNKVTFNISNSGSYVYTHNDGNIKYDSSMGMCYLDKNEAISFAYICYVDRSDVVEDIAENTVTMKYVDYLNAGVIVSETEVVADTSDTSSEGANDGECKVINGNILESSVIQTRGEIVPGIKKSPISYTDPTTNVTTDYDYYALYDSIINWKIRLENSGYMPIYKYTVTDTMEAPYIFDDSQNINIDVYENSGKLLGSGSIALSEDVRAEGGTDVSVDMTVYNNDWAGKPGTVYTVDAHVEITYDEQSNEETLSIFLDSQYTAIPYLGYIELSLSTKNPTNTYTNKTYINETKLIPHDVSFSEVLSGIPNTDSSGAYESIVTHAPVNVVFGYATASQKKVEELDVNVENIATSSGNPNFITLSDKDNTFKYTLTVMAPENIPMNKLVLIDSLPEVGDHSPYDVDVVRGSEFNVYLAKDQDGNIIPNFNVAITYSDGTSKVLDSSLNEYKVEYSDEIVFDSSDRNGSKLEGWYDTPTENTRSFRVIIDGETVPMPIKSTITVSFDAEVDDPDAEPGDIAWNNFGYYYNVQILADGSLMHFEAMPLEVGVRIPSHPTLQKKLVYQEGVTSYVHDMDLEFTYLVHKGEALLNYDNITESSFTDNQVTVIKLNVPVGYSESVVNKRLLEDVNCYSLEDGVWIENENDPFIWETGVTYTVYELPHEDFKLRRLAGQKKNIYTFTFNPSVDRTFVCENSPIEWDIYLTKVDSADNTKLLSGAGFALYTKDVSEADGKTVPENLATVLEETIEVSGETWYFVDNAVTDENGELGFENLRSEVYYLYEYHTPDGYYAKTRGQNIYYSDTIKGVNSLTVENVAGTFLPMTGGNGTGKLVAIGLTIMAASVVMLGLKKRKMKAL